VYIPKNVGYNLSFVKKKKSVHFLQTLLHLSGIRENGVRCVTLKKMFCILIFERKVISFIVNQYLHVKVQFATKQVKIV